MTPEPYSDIESGTEVVLRSNYWSGSVKVEIHGGASGIAGEFAARAKRNLSEDPDDRFYLTGTTVYPPGNDTVYLLGDEDRINVAFSRGAAIIGAIHVVMVDDVTVLEGDDGDE